MAQFFRINGGSTQHRGVVPDIVFPTASGAAEHGEREEGEAAQQVVFGRIGDSRDVAYPIVFLCSDRAQWIISSCTPLLSPKYSGR